MEDIKKIKIATRLADAMIKEINDNKLIEDVLEHSDNMDDLMATVTQSFALKLMPLIVEYAESEEVQKDMTEQDKAELEAIKNLFNINK